MKEQRDIRYNKNDIVRLEITDIQAEGMGVGKVGGYALFVKDTVVGDVIDARIVKVKKSYGYGRVERIISPSPKRVEPRCPIARACGGCQLQAMSYDAQLDFKENKVRNALARIGGFDAGFVDSIMEPIIGMDDPWRYRNKAQYPIGTDKDGNPVAGFYAGRTHDIIPCTDCLLGISENKEILEAVLSYMKEHNIPAYDEKTGEGVVRHVLIRKGFATGEIMVCIVCRVCHGDGSSVCHGDGSFGTSLISFDNIWLKHKDVPKEPSPWHTEEPSPWHTEEPPPWHAEEPSPCLKSVSVSINNKNTNVIMGNEIHTVWGRDKINDVLLGKKFEISPLSFYQVNPIQVEKLYGTAIEYSHLTGNEEVWDICCGIGTISLCMTDKARVVHGLEIVPEAIEDAKRNAMLNKVDNVEFICAAAEEYLPAHKDEIRADVVVMDPPRKGMDEAALAAVVDIAPARIVYVSCDPATLARDLKYLTGHGYELKRIRCTDMFCQTVHVEVATLLERVRNAKEHVQIGIDAEDYYRIKDSEKKTE